MHLKVREINKSRDGIVSDDAQSVEILINNDCKFTITFDKHCNGIRINKYHYSDSSSMQILPSVSNEIIIK